MKKQFYIAPVCLGVLLLFNACSGSKQDAFDPDSFTIPAPAATSVAETTIAETESTEEIPTSDIADDSANSDDSSNRVQVSEFIGKTYGEALEAGYSYYGYMGEMGEYTFYLQSYEMNDSINASIDKWKSKTLKDLLDADIEVNHSSSNGNYTFHATIGSIIVDFEIEGAAEIIEKYDDDIGFTSLDEMPELFNKTLSNMTYSSFIYYVTLESAAGDAISDADFSDDKEDILKDFIIEDMYYEIR